MVRKWPFLPRLGACVKPKVVVLLDLLIAHLAVMVLVFGTPDRAGSKDRAQRGLFVMCKVVE